MSGQIFISYSSKDREFVNKLAEDLELRGIDVWIDQGEIVAGEKTWPQQIVEAIKSCSVFFIILSPNSFSSKEVNRELNLAVSNQKPIIPIYYECEEIPNSMAYQLSVLQQLDFSSGEYEENLQDLLDNLRREGFQIQDLEKEADDVDSRVQAESKEFPNYVKRVPVWGWIIGAFVVIVLLGLFASGIIRGSSQESTPTVEIAEVVILPTDTYIPPTWTDVPPTDTETPDTNTPDPTEIIKEDVVIPEDTPTPEKPTATDIPSPTPIPTLIEDARGVKMVFVPAGEFMMGSNIQEDNAKPAHLVETGEYYIDKYEVTNASYAMCVRDGNCQPPRSMSSGKISNYYTGQEYSNYPVVWVSWHDAIAYCAWRGGRLPTEAEWEKAARGEDRRTYPWGDEIGTACLEANYWERNGCGGPFEVGTTTGESAYRAFDMAGNVWEWVQDEIRPYPGGSAGSVKSSELGNKILRGGSWEDSDSKIKTTFRFNASPDADDDDIGIRCVVDLSSQ